MSKPRHSNSTEALLVLSKEEKEHFNRQRLGFALVLQSHIAKNDPLSIVSQFLTDVISVKNITLVNQLCSNNLICLFHVS